MRRALKIIVALLSLGVVAAVAFVAFLPTERIAKIAGDQVKAATGRSLTLTGGLSPSFFPVLGVETGAVALGNAEWGEAPALIAASGVRIGIDLAPLIRGEIRIREVRLEDPVVSLEVNEAGEANWEFAGAEGGDGGGDGGGIQSLIVDELFIENGALTFVDRRGGARIELDRLNAEATLPGLDQPLAVTGSANWREKKITLDFGLSNPAALLRGEETALRLSLASDAGSASYDGKVTRPGPDGRPRAAGVFHLASKDPAAAFGWAAGAPAPDALEGLTDLNLDGDIVLTETAKAALTGAVTRGGKAATLSLAATGGADWAERRAFAVNLDAAVNDLFRFVYKGDVAADSGRFPVALNGAYDLTAAAPAAAAEWVSGAAPAPLADFAALTLKGAVSLSGSGLSFSAKGGGMRGDRHASVDLSMTGGADWPTTRAFALKADAALDGAATLVFAGDIAAPESGSPSVDGAVEFDSPDLRALARLAALPLPDNMPPDAFRTLSFKGDLSIPAAGGVRLKATALSLDALTLSGALGIAAGERLTLNGDLRAGDVDLTPYLGAADSAPPPAGASGWSRERIDLTALSTFDARIGVRVKSATLPQMKVGASQIEATVSDGRLDLQIEKLGLYGGGVTGSVTLDGARGNAFSAAFSASGVKLRPALRNLAGITSLEGLGAGGLNVSGAGETLDEIMRSLEGFGEMKLTDGALVGYNLAAMARNLGAGLIGGDGGAQKTDFSEISSVFTISGGVLRTTDFALLGPLIRVSGEGSVDLGAQTVDARLTPKAVATLKGQGGDREKSGLAFPLIVTGPWAALSIRPDLKTGLDLLLTDPSGAADAVKDLIQDGAAGTLGGAAKGALEALTAPKGQSKPPRQNGKKQGAKGDAKQDKPAPIVDPTRALNQLLKGVLKD
ncbi:AsmA family protein [Pikeienuella sp. HZG-20]|uniref:AsmA family protein n=1 Tax=Paludibacillus litoralis TaxID=3133267 RepID=UPI0030EE72C2